MDVFYVLRGSGKFLTMYFRVKLSIKRCYDSYEDGKASTVSNRLSTSVSSTKQQKIVNQIGNDVSLSIFIVDSCIQARLMR